MRRRSRLPKRRRRSRRCRCRLPPHPRRPPRPSRARWRCRRSDRHWTSPRRTLRRSFRPLWRRA
ncbi:hypothetical protein EO081_08760 [Sphingomonas desiccabilis]|uniref:Uncharacterized protein n=1 Tax=Sphingomonas desiccabilis TaxID=429134 RepID=A0A4Q2ISM5_9SPHN|nr:hypothetical protein EO081_08760 [Sphingomonas desiccabilis]